MSFISVLFALLLEQARPLTRGNPVHAAMLAWVRWCGHSLDAGTSAHGWFAWSLAVLGPATGAFAVYALLDRLIGWPLALVWCALVLYASLGFRQFSFHFTQIRDALADGDDALARRLLADWQRADEHELARSELVGRVIEASVLSAHRHVFGVLAWFSVFAALGLGPAGAVLYRLGELAARYWCRPRELPFQPSSAALQHNARQAWMLMDWLPARVTAIGFAVVGNFEEAIDGWRRYAQQGGNSNDGLLLAATAGAVNIDLRAGAALHTPGLATGEFPAQGRPAPELPHLAIVVGLVWRTVVMWLLLLALLTLARLLG